MAINVDEAFGLEQFGIVFKDDDSNVLSYITFGNGSPVGTQAPVPTVYIEDNGSVWRKFNTGLNDWKKLIEDRFIDRIYPDDLEVPADKAVFLHCPCFTTGNLILEGEAIIL